FHVTGDQTCALPIFGGHACGGDGIGPGLPTSPGLVGPDEPHPAVAVPEQVLDGVARPLVAVHPDARHALDDVVEDGRGDACAGQRGEVGGGDTGGDQHAVDLPEIGRAHVCTPVT